MSDGKRLVTADGREIGTLAGQAEARSLDALLRVDGTNTAGTYDVEIRTKALAGAVSFRRARRGCFFAIGKL